MVVVVVSEPPPLPVSVSKGNLSASSTLSPGVSKPATWVISTEPTNVSYQSCASHTAASARMLSARSSSSGTPAHARRKARLSTSGSSIESHSHSRRTSGPILGPKYCSWSSVKVGGVKVRQAESMNSVRLSIDEEEREVGSHVRRVDRRTNRIF